VAGASIGSGGTFLLILREGDALGSLLLLLQDVECPPLENLMNGKYVLTLLSPETTIDLPS
jgi:hypothetical protein